MPKYNRYKKNLLYSVENVIGAIGGGRFELANFQEHTDLVYQFYIPPITFSKERSY